MPIERSDRRWKCNIKTHFKKVDKGAWIGLIPFRTGISGKLL
jgi:hypothetical protein